jgi:hypothetical protein
LRVAAAHRRVSSELPGGDLSICGVLSRSAFLPRGSVEADQHALGDRQLDGPSCRTVVVSMLCRRCR